MKTITLVIFIISSVANSQNDSQSEPVETPLVESGISLLSKESCSRIEQLEHKVCLLEARLDNPISESKDGSKDLLKELGRDLAVASCNSALTEACADYRKPTPTLDDFIKDIKVKGRAKCRWPSDDCRYPHREFLDEKTDR